MCRKIIGMISIIFFPIFSISAEYSMDSLISSYSAFAKMAFGSSDYKFEKLKEQFLLSVIGKSISFNIKIAAKIEFKEQNNTSTYEYGRTIYNSLPNQFFEKQKVGLENYIFEYANYRYLSGKEAHNNFIFYNFLICLYQQSDQFAMSVNSGDFIQINGIITNFICTDENIKIEIEITNINKLVYPKES